MLARGQLYTLEEILDAASVGQLPSASLYLTRTDDVRLESSCMLVPDDEDVETDEAGIPILAARHGLRCAALNRDMIQDVVAWAGR